MPREPIPTWFFSLVVVQHEDRFLLGQERKHDQSWYVPAGRVEPGETFAEAAVRETREETGVPVRLVGIVRVEHSPALSHSRMQVIFLAEPLGDTPPKSIPDEESLGATWVGLRGDEVRELFEHVATGGRAYPLDLLQHEGLPFASRFLNRLWSRLPIAVRAASCSNIHVG